ncbi:hypothetical protein [Methanobrevibacter sp.]|uniref:hypothetical protein n=1 Tax=Methanobrevibacter sp. TaxID=66852 RepID=UPI00388E9094
MIKKIAPILIILIFGISAAYALNINDLKMPNDYSKKVGEGSYIIPNAYDNPRFIVKEYNESELNFKNTSKYSFWPTREKNIYYFKDNQKSDLGAMELIELDGKKYTVSSLYATTVIDEGYNHDALNYIVQFNNKNNIDPITP